MEDQVKKGCLSKLTDEELQVLTLLKAEIFGHDKSLFNAIVDIEDVKQIINNLQEIELARLKELGISVFTMNRIRLKIFGKKNCDSVTVLGFKTVKTESQIFS